MNTSNTGFKISSYPTALVNKLTKKGKLQYDHYLMSYAETNFGFSTINKNYKIPVESLRRDFMGFLGVENAKGQWRQLQRIWYGDWYAEKEVTDKNGVTTVIGDKVNSYLYRWNLNEIGQEDYVLNKFGDETELDHQDKLPTDRIFIVKNAPIPCEYTIATKFKQQKTDENGNIVYEDITYTSDPYPHLTKIVDKDYIDNRFNGIPIIDKTDTVYHDSPANKPVTLDDDILENFVVDENANDSPTLHEFKSTLEIRPYTCIYDYNFTGKDNYVDWIDIVDALECGNGKTTKELIKGKLLTFFIRISRPKSQEVDGYIRINGKVETRSLPRAILLTTNGIFDEKDKRIEVAGDDGTILYGEGEIYFSNFVKWAFSGERHQIIKQSYEAKRDILIKCQCYYDKDDNLCINASSAVNYEPGSSTISGVIPYISDNLIDDDKSRIPSSYLLWRHSIDPNLISGYDTMVNKVHVRKQDREAWDGHIEEDTMHFTGDEKNQWKSLIDKKVETISPISDSDYIIIEREGNAYEISVKHSGIEQIETKPEVPGLVTKTTLFNHIKRGVLEDGNNVLGNKIPLHVIEEEKDYWNGKIDLIKSDNFFTIAGPQPDNGEIISTINLKTTPDIAGAIEKNEKEEDETQKTNLAETVPTTQGVIDYVKDHSGIKYDDTKTPFGNFRFKGSHVFMIETEDEDNEKVIEFYFGPNNNPPYITTIEDIKTAGNYYIYESSKNPKSWELPTGFKHINGKDTTYDIVYPVSPKPSFTLKVNNGEEISMAIGDKHPEEFGSAVEASDLKQITVSLYKKPSNEAIAEATCYLPILKDKNGVFKFDENLAGFNGSETDIANKKIVSKIKDNKDICLTLTDLKLNQKEDVNDGLYTGFVRFKATISINKDASKSNVFSNPGSYYLTLTDGRNTEPVRSAKDIFIYSGEDASLINAPTVALDYIDNTNTATVSGITYQTNPQLNISVSRITGTQQQITKTLNRLNLTKTETSPNAYSELANDTAINKSNLGIQSGKTLFDDAVFQFNNTYNIKSKNDVGCFGTTITAKPYKRDNVVSSAAGSDSITQDPSKWIWNHSTTQSACNIVSFGIPNNEKYPRLLYNTNICASSLSNPTFSINTLFDDTGHEIEFDDGFSLNPLGEGDEVSPYYTQLLVQGGWLKYPSTDSTKRYESIKENTQSKGYIRHYVRKVRFLDSSGQDKESSLGEIEISIDNFNKNDFNTSDRKVSLWLAQKYDDGSEPALSLLNATSDLVNNSNEIGCAIIDSNEPDGTTYKWKFTNSLTKAWFSGKDYYLIIAMHPTFAGKLGTIKFKTL